MPTALLAAVPYRTLPDFPLGPITIRPFGLMVALGIVLGTVIGSRYVANRGMDPEEYTSLATRAVIAGLIGARVTWVLSHLGAIQSPIDVIAVWDGGMQFSGGLLFGAIAGWASARGRYSRTQRWQILDGTAVGLAVGLAIGRLGCMAVGEHFGGETDFFLGMTYLGGGTIEPATVGQTIHNTAFYELLHLLVLSAIFAVVLRQAGDRQRPWPLGMLGTMFLLWYGVFRFITDSVRVNDTRLAGLTGAQWASFGLVALGISLLVTMGGRRASQDGRAVVPVTTEPKSAVKLLAGSHTAAVADNDVILGDAASGGDAGDEVERSWADRADVRDGSAGFVDGVRVVPDPYSASEDPLPPDEFPAEDDTSLADTSRRHGNDSGADDTSA